MKAKSIILIIALLAIISQSCKNYLEEELISDVSASSYYTTPAGLEDAVDATYGYLKYIYGPPERGFTMNTFGTDVHTNGADGSHKVVNWYDNNFNASQGMVRETWRYCYQGINQANAVLNRAQSIEGLDEALLQQRLAEVRFIRAFWYFYLVQHWGDVHLSLEETEGVEVEANKTPASEIYSTAIIPDLQFAVENLPEPADQSDYGRATKAAAEFILAKVFMTRAYKSYGEGNTDAQKAEQLMTNVIEDYSFELLDDFADLWDINNQLNSEVIWSVQNTQDLILNGDQGNRGHLYFLMEYDKLPGMSRDTENGRPWKRFRPTNFSLGMWDRDNDSRYDKSYKHVWISNYAGNIPKWTADDEANGYGIEGEPKFQVGDTAVFIPGPGKDAEWPAARKAATRYNVYTSDQYTERLYPSLNKFIDPLRPDRQWTNGSRDFVVARLADAYLIRAEARLMQGNTSDAADDINVVRTRAAWDGMEANMEIAAGDVTLDFLLDERARELDGEMHRWMDLVRTGKLVERVRLYNDEAGGNIQEYHNLRPIPQEQIDRTLGGYPQNCGYPGSTCG